MHRFFNTLLNLLVPALALLMLGCKASSPPNVILVEAMPVRVVIGDDGNAPSDPVQQRPVMVTLTPGRNYFPGQEFAVEYYVHNPTGDVVRNDSVVEAASPRSVKPTGPGANQFTFNIQAKKKTANGAAYKVEVRVSYQGHGKLSENSFDASP